MALKPEWWDAVSPYLDQALEKADEERAVWLAGLRAQSPDLAAHLEALLDEHRVLADEGFLDGGPAVFPLETALAGKTIGAYTLRAPIGEGGMGTVWLAERSDGEIRQTVAIKFLSAAGRRPGWRDRFLKERQLLASLNHPAIVRLFDAGQTDDGQPFLVMEYVDGHPIDVHAAQIPLAERLALFLRVCDGVAHAHRRLIVHRDLKPSNILVDRTGQPKLLDFGIAKLLDDGGDATATIERVLTPKYASPEQFRGAAQTTATDVYSLAAVLYRLLTGHSPHESEDGTWRAAELLAGTHEIAPPRRLNPDLPTDLDYILRKALRHEPEERYVSVDAFADDIRALLESRPVEARGGDRWYKTRKLVRRYRVVLTAAALVVVSLSVGLYAANRQRRIAERRFQQVRQLANEFFALDAKIQMLPGATDARRQIVSASIGYLEALGKEAHDDRDLALDIASAYLQVARVQGVPTGSNLGEFEAADNTLNKAETTVDDVLRAEPANRRALQTSAEISHDRMILANGGAPDRQVAEARKATREINAFLALGNATPAEITRDANLFINVALAYKNVSRYDDAIGAAQKAEEIVRSVNDKDAQRTRGRALTRLAEMLRVTGHLEKALDAVREAEPIVEKADYPSAMQRALAMEFVVEMEASILGLDSSDRISLHRAPEAIDRYQKAFDLMEQLAVADPHDSQSRYREVGDGLTLAALLAPRDPQQALVVYDRLLLRLSETKESENRRLNEAECLAVSSPVLCRIGRTGEARARLDAAFARLAKLKHYPAPKVPLRDWADIVLRAKGAFEECTGDVRTAAETYQGLLDKVIASGPSPETDLRDASSLSDLYGELASLYRQLGRPDRAQPLETSRLTLWRQWDRRLPDNSFVHRQLETARSISSF